MSRLANNFLLSIFIFTIFALFFSNSTLAQTNQTNQGNDFGISIAPASIVLAPGEVTNFSITINGVAVDNVKLSLLSLPPFDIVLGNKINSAADAIKPLLVKVPSDSQPGDYEVTVAGVVDGVTQIATAKLSVVAGPAKLPVLLVSIPFDNTIAIAGISFNPSTKVFINGQDFTDSSTISDSSIVIKGSKKELAIVKGQNVLELKINGITTNVLTFRLGTKK